MEKVDYYIFIIYIKINDKTTYYQRIREILNRAKEYYKKTKKD